jgi:hypothetical protein
VEEYNFQRLVLQAIFQTSYFGYGEGLMRVVLSALKRCATQRHPDGAAEAAPFQITFQ